MKELPPPITIIQCPRLTCGLVARLARDRSGYYCGECFRPLDATRVAA